MLPNYIAVSPAPQLMQEVDPKMRENYPDNHPKKGYVNWWEVELGDIDKGRERQEAKRNIKKELNDETIGRND